MHGPGQILLDSEPKRIGHPSKHRRKSGFYPQPTIMYKAKKFPARSKRSLTRSVTEEEEGKTRGRNDKLRGQIGVRTIALNEGWTIGPPADSEYAVEPVGVETMRPSQTASVKCCPSTNTSIVFRCGLGPRWSETSFMTCQPSAMSATVYLVMKVCGRSVGRLYIH